MKVNVFIYSYIKTLKLSMLLHTFLENKILSFQSHRSEWVEIAESIRIIERQGTREPGVSVINNGNVGRLWRMEQR